MALESLINKYDIIEYEYKDSNKRKNVFYVDEKTISCLNDHSSRLIKNGYEVIFKNNSYKLYFKNIKIHKIKIRTAYWNLFRNFHKACFIYLLDKEDNRLYRYWYEGEAKDKGDYIINKLLSKSQLEELNEYLKNVNSNSLWIFIQKMKLLQAEADRKDYKVNYIDIEFEVT